LVAKDPVSMEFSFDVPHNAVPSYWRDSNDITWKIKAIIYINKKTDWENEIQFKVL
jgi:hypothetical protein